MKKTLIFLIIFCYQLAFANTIKVSKDGPIRTLHKAVDLAKDGDTILLNKGIYREGNIIINKSISLIGVQQPVLDGEGKNEILTVSGYDILIQGIHFANAGYSSLYDFAALKILNSTHLRIQNNWITNSYFGLHINNTSFVVVRNNQIKKYTQNRTNKWQRHPPLEM